MHTEQNDENLHFESRLDLSALQQAVNQIRIELGKVIVGQHKMVDLLITALLANGHVLLQGVPGVAKTLTAKLLAKSMSVDYSRIQFTPDLMPSDVLGTAVFNMQKSEFSFQKGPVFSNLVLIDEINRAPAKTQAALFEVMEERQITMDGTTYPLDAPFMVLATQNPIEQEGTYRLPEAQLDRFLFLINIDYPNVAEEIEIIRREHQLLDGNKLGLISTFLQGADIVKYQSLIHHIRVETHLIEYIANITQATRSNPSLYLGASPRASIAMLNASKAYAAINGRDFITPDDIKMVAVPILSHRVMVNPEREMEGINASQIIDQIINQIPAPK